MERKDIEADLKEAIEKGEWEKVVILEIHDAMRKSLMAGEPPKMVEGR